MDLRDIFSHLYYTVQFSTLTCKTALEAQQLYVYTDFMKEYSDKNPDYIELHVVYRVAKERIDGVVDLLSHLGSSHSTRTLNVIQEAQDTANQYMNDYRNNN